jgi:hypothetical protein
MSMSPQSGGFQRCTGAGPRPRRAVSASPPIAASGDFEGFAIFWRSFIGEFDIGEFESGILWVDLEEIFSM